MVLQEVVEQVLVVLMEQLHQEEMVDQVQQIQLQEVQ
jgi:hypothetical protein